MSKLIKSGDEARKALEAGVNTLAVFPKIHSLFKNFFTALPLPPRRRKKQDECCRIRPVFSCFSPLSAPSRPGHSPWARRS